MTQRAPSAGKPSSAAPDKEQRGIQSIEVGGRILKAMGAEARPMPMRDLVKAAGMASGKIHPYLVSFNKIGLVSQDPVTGYYRLGPLAIQLGLTSLMTLDPIREATPFAEALAEDTGFSVALVVWGNLGPTVVRIFDRGYALHTNMRVGSVMSLSSTATGRLFSALLPSQVVSRMLADDSIRLGPNIAAPLEPQVLEELMRETRERRMSRGRNHPTPGLSSFSAPVFNHLGDMVLAITITAPSALMNAEWDSPVAKALRDCTDNISFRLGYKAD